MNSSKVGFGGTSVRVRKDQAPIMISQSSINTALSGMHHPPPSHFSNKFQSGATIYRKESDSDIEEEIEGLNNLSSPRAELDRNMVFTVP